MDSLPVMSGGVLAAISVSLGTVFRKFFSQKSLFFPAQHVVVTTSKAEATSAVICQDFLCLEGI